MYCHFLIPSLGLDYGMYSLNVDDDVIEMSKYVKDYKIMLVYVEHGSSIVDTSMFDSSPEVNRNVRKEWEKVSSKSSSIGEVMKKLSYKVTMQTLGSRSMGMRALRSRW
ncbi:hypothetical protein Tco_1512026 [Tanacetum coccineum]